RIGEEPPFDQTTREVAPQQRMVQREQLGREQALQVGAELHLEDLLARALERAAAERERLLAHATDDGRELPELRVRRQPATELDLPPRGRASRPPETGSPALRLLGRLADLARHPRRRRWQRRARTCRHLSETLGDEPALLPEARLGDVGRMRDVLSNSFRCVRGQLVHVLHLLGATAELVLAPLEIPEVEQVAARQQALVPKERQHLLSDQQRA